MEITYEAIESLVAGTEQRGDILAVTFKCPTSGTEIPSRGTLAPREKEADPNGNMTSSLRRSMSHVLRGVFGRTPKAGEAVSSDYSEEAKRAATVEAFEAVQTQFVWEAKSGTWMSVEAAGADWTEFAKQLFDGPVVEDADCDVLARMLVEIANADGRLAEEEKIFLNEFLVPNFGTVETLSNKPALSADELGATSAGRVRDTMLMLAWALALVDEDLDSREEARLGELADGLGLGPNLVLELKRFAQEHVIDQALEVAYRGGQRDDGRYAEVQTLAKKIKLRSTNVERVEQRLRKRHGLA